MKTSVALKTLLGAASLALPLMTFAESNVSTGAGALTALAHVDFTITIPKVLYLRVGTGSSYTTGVLAANPAIDSIVFAPTAAQVGNGVNVPGTGGDLTNGVVTAAIVGNSGAITITSTSTGTGLSDGAGDNIAFTQITTTPATLTSGTALPAPAAAGGTVVVPAPAKFLLQDAKWTYGYANTTTPPAGTYGATVANGSRVTYTASMP